MLSLRPMLTRTWPAIKIVGNNFLSSRTFIHDRIISLPCGKIRGAQRMTLYEETYYSFEGIPFAKPPVDELRFAAPEPNESWNGILDCLSPGCKPTQVNEQTGKIEGGEDCLYLNVYVKTFQSANFLPVLVWICGGGFHIGEGAARLYGADYFMHENVVLVGFNYRLGALGFLSLADPALDVPGNAGLKDQVLALRWVKKNIAFFNGDENNIFVFGESAGGACTHYMTITKQTKGLFQKAALMSGCVLNNWSHEPPLDNAYRLAKLIGYSGENRDAEVLKYLRCVQAPQLVLHDIVTVKHKMSGKFILFVPTIEPYETDECVVPKAPIDMVRFAWSNEIPMMLGGTEFEGLIMYDILNKNLALLDVLRAQPQLILPLDIAEKYKSKESSKSLAEKLLALYEIEPCPTKQNIINYCRLCSEKFFWHGMHRTACSRLLYATAPTYLYRFAFDSPHQSFHRNKYCGTDEVAGVAHADELPYLFNMKDSWRFPCECPEYHMIKCMVSIWTSFARKSNPNNERLPIVWRPLRKLEPNMALNIGETIEMKEIPEAQKLAFWNSMYQRYDLY